MIIGLALVSILILSLVAIHSPRISSLIIALASISALTALVLFQLGAYTAAVIELSVGAGLVAVLFAFTNSLLNANEAESHPPIVRRSVAALVAVAVLLLLFSLIQGALPSPSESDSALAFEIVFWEQRGPDIFVQLALIFTGALGVLGLLSDEAESQRAAHSFSRLSQEGQTKTIKPQKS